MRSEPIRLSVGLQPIPFCPAVNRDLDYTMGRGKRRFMLVRAAIAIALMLSAGTVSLPAKGKTEQADVPRDYSNGLAAGQRDARDCGIAVLSGLRLGKRNLILPWVIGTEMPGGDLVGKSAEYVGGYVEEYRNKAKPKRFLYSLAGAEVEPPANTGKDTKRSAWAVRV